MSKHRIPGFLRSTSTNATDALPIVQLWILRILIKSDGYRTFITEHGFANDALAEILGLGQWIDPETKDFDLKAVRIALRKRHENAERELDGERSPDYLGANLVRIAALVGLSDTDCRVLEFATMIQHEQLLDDAADYLGHLSSAKTVSVLALILNLPEAELRACLGVNGILARSGLMSIDRSGNSNLSGKLNLLSESFADHLCFSDADPVSLLRETVTASTSAQLCIHDYSHIEPTLAVLRPYLKKVLQSKQKGVNIFAYGASGTGKTQLAKVLAAEIACELFEVASEDTEGNPVFRIAAFSASSCYAGSSGGAQR